MSSIYEEHAALIQKYREKVIQMRTKQEQALDRWWAELKGIDPMYYATLDLPEEVSLRTMVPEIYKDVPNKEVYLEQMAKLNELLDRVNKLGEAYEEETRKCIQELQGLISAGT